MHDTLYDILQYPIHSPPYEHVIIRMYMYTEYIIHLQFIDHFCCLITWLIVYHFSTKMFIKEKSKLFSPWQHNSKRKIRLSHSYEFQL